MFQYCLSTLANRTPLNLIVFKAVLQAWDKRIPAIEKGIAKNRHNSAGHTLVLNQQYELPELSVSVLKEPEITYHNLKSYQTMLNEAGLSLAHVLIGGVEVEQFPELQVSATQPIEIQLETVLNHPLFQVY